MKKHNIKIGDRFGRLCVIGFGKNYGRVIAMCDCGNELERKASQILVGDVKSCGCLRMDAAIARNKNELAFQNGLCATPTGSSWWAMIERCYRKNSGSYHNYGAIGIVVCEYLRSTIGNLVELIGHRTNGMTLDRISSFGNYSCGKCAECLSKGWDINVRWATRFQQCRNRRNNRIATINGISKCASQWAEESGVKAFTIISRLNRGWSGESLLNKVNQAHDE